MDTVHTANLLQFNVKIFARRLQIIIFTNRCTSRMFTMLKKCLSILIELNTRLVRYANQDYYIMFLSIRTIRRSGINENIDGSLTIVVQFQQ